MELYEKLRKEVTLMHGLPEDASWNDILTLYRGPFRKRLRDYVDSLKIFTLLLLMRFNNDNGELRKQAALKRGLPENASWFDISRFDDEKI